MEGSYTIQVAPGTYNMIVSYISFISDTLTGVTVAAGEVLVKETLLFENLQAQKELEVVITAKRDLASTVTLYNTKRNSINTIDGVSIDLIKRTGDPNVAAAMQRITGVTVEGGKYVYVRGLGDRYSKATLNGSEIPGLDPNRNTVQMDIFPSNLVDQIVVYKNFTPDLPGSFSGGLVDIRTKDFPTKFQLNVSTSWGFNPQANFRKDFLTYQRGKKDWLGMDDGTRAIPDFIQNLAPSKVPDRTFQLNDEKTIQTIDAATKSFRTSIYPHIGRSGANQSHQISLGDQFNVFGRPFGYIASLAYRKNFSAYDNGYVGRWRNISDATQKPPLIADRLLNQLSLDGAKGEEEVLWGSLIKLSYKPFEKHKISFNYMHNQSGNSSTRYMIGELPVDAIGLIFETRVMGYLQRSLDIFQLEGEHAFGKNGNFKIDWIASQTESLQEEPDLRFFSNDYEQDGEKRLYDIQSNLYRDPSRFFRNLSETNKDAKLNLAWTFKQWGGKNATIKFGGAYTSKNRQFSEKRFEFQQGNAAQRYEGDPAAYFSPQNMGVFVDEVCYGVNCFEQVAYKVFVQDVSELRNVYRGQQEIWAAYGMLTLPLSKKFKLITGARFEATDAFTETDDPDKGRGILELKDILPAFNMIYGLRSNMNLRAGYGRTLARPTFREFAPFTSFNFVQDFLLSGNPNLSRTLIDNFDLRWEWYPALDELISVSAFSKRFTNPIEKVIEARAPGSSASAEQIYANVDRADALGVEVEFKKNLGFLGAAFSHFQLGGNVSFLRSRVDINADELAKIHSVDPTRPNRRPLYGQSPYSFNGELAYIHHDNGIRASLSYNVFGERIVVVGGTEPDVYEQPRGLLNFSVSKTLTKGFSLRLRANNLLDPEYKYVQRYKGQEFIYESYSAGRSFSLSLTYNLK
ncbi:MAG: TonB-dependent receptor [Bacteroidetes bacterium]|nr:MAG: TonB-dependent receptor [Bacteroidota bacterium]